MGELAYMSSFRNIYQINRNLTPENFNSRTINSMKYIMPTTQEACFDGRELYLYLSVVPFFVIPAVGLQ